MSTEQTLVTDSLKNTIDTDWTWLREHNGFWRHSAAGVEIRVEPGVADTVQNALLRAAPDRLQGTYAVEVDVFNHALPTQQYEQAGITWYNDGKPVFKLVKEFIDGDLYIIPGRKPMSTRGVRLRLIVTADTWEAQYRPDGDRDYKIAEAGPLPAPNNDQVSIQCYNGPKQGEHWIRFANFTIDRL